jgi:two-component system sensor histidine kinase/response regulator
VGGSGKDDTAGREAVVAELERERAERAAVEADLRAQIQALTAKLSSADVRVGERAQKIFQNAADAILLVDRHGTYTYATDSIERVTGYSVQETVGTNAADWLHPEDLAEHYAKVAALREGRWVGPTSPATQYRRRHKTRGWVWVEALGANMIDDPAVGAIVVTMRDMTERRRIQEELQGAKDAAEAASFTKSAFLANMSHELRTPLNGVIGMVDLLARSALDDRQRRHTEVARASADLLLAVINDILDFSKIEAGKLELEEVPFTMAEVVEEVASVLALAAEQKGLELSCHATLPLAQPLLGDPARVRQVLMNLVNNAVKFTPRGEVAILATTEGEPATVEHGPDRVGVRIDVRDTGIGISPEGQQRLFQPFSQGDVSTTRIHGGTGLGLAISRQLVARMGGSLTVESDAGKGATFTIRLPLVRARDVAAQPAPLAIAHLQGRRVLAVDDNGTNRQVLEEHLRGVGMRCDSAPDAPSALRLLREAAGKDPYALAIVDVNMPGMDGLDLVRVIKGDARISSTVLLVLGSLGKPLDPGEQRALGIAGYTSKPVWRRQLFRVICDALADPTMTAAPRASSSPLAGIGPDVPAAIVAAGSGRPRRALVVEDSEINAEVAGELLRAAGIEFDLAVNGTRAVAATLERRYDFVLMDCQLPEMDGFEATRQIRAHERAGALPGRQGARLPILALTASATTGDLDRCVAAGMDGYVTKPVDAHRLFEAISRSTGRGG